MTNSLFNDNRLKLGICGLNVSNGCAATTAEGHLVPTWQNNLDIARMADRAGFEALVRVARWKGFGGKTNFNGASFESYTWAAGLAAATQQMAVLSTSHVPPLHPVVAAKQATTIDDEFDYTGRYFNIIEGWHQPKPIQKPFPPIMNAGSSATGAGGAFAQPRLGWLPLDWHAGADCRPAPPPR